MNCKGNLISLDEPKIMGILNITPDSFYKNSRTDLTNLIEKAQLMIDEGADFLDVGGFSSRPGAIDIPEDDELRRVIPAIDLLVKKFPDIPISVDTFRSKVAKEAVKAGAALINDITGGDGDKQPDLTLVPQGFLQLLPNLLPKVWWHYWNLV